MMREHQNISQGTEYLPHDYDYDQDGDQDGSWEYRGVNLNKWRKSHETSSYGNKWNPYHRETNTNPVFIGAM